MDGCGAVPQVLLSGQEKYALLCTDSVMVANGQGNPMRQIALLRRNAFTIAAPIDSDVRTVADLKGGSLGITEGSGGEIGLVQIALENAGLDPRIKGNEDVDIKVVGAGGPGAYNALQSGDIDAYAAALNDLAVMQPLGLESRSIIPEELQQLPSSGLTLMEDTLADERDREVTIKLARGWVKGNEFAVEHPQEALAIVCERAPEQCKDMDVARAYMKSVLQTIATVDGLEPGEQAPIEGYETVEDALLASGDLESEVDLETIFTNDYLREIDAGG
ncbi:MAG: hypothetical protein GEU88_00950 [Solirubrobacterales bacterium]|nr:hypothetical protein [Solirubrobacterales bacterium]